VCQPVGFQEFDHLAGDVGGVLADAAEQGRAHAVLEAHAEEGETRSAGCDATPMQRIAVDAEHRQFDPAEVGAEAGAPDYRADSGEDTSLSEHRGVIVGQSQSWMSRPRKRVPA
jgi:hypothetical protein